MLFHLHKNSMRWGNWGSGNLKESAQNHLTKNLWTMSQTTRMWWVSKPLQNSTQFYASWKFQTKWQNKKQQQKVSDRLRHCSHLTEQETEAERPGNDECRDGSHQRKQLRSEADHKQHSPLQSGMCHKTQDNIIKSQASTGKCPPPPGVTLTHI